MFFDCQHLLTNHEPGNELHIVPEIALPGGSVDYFLTSVRENRPMDFVGIELQALDTTGSVWSERQRFLAAVGVTSRRVEPDKSFGINWKMTAKTTLVQLHHKATTLEHVSKHLVLVIQEQLLSYFRETFDFGGVTDARLGDSVHFHAYRLAEHGGNFKLELVDRASTDAAGIARCLGIQAEPRMEVERILSQLERKLSDRTRLDTTAVVPQRIEDEV